MNKIKKLSIAILVFAMIALLVVTAFAFDNVAYVAKAVDCSQLCVSSAERDVTVTVSASGDIQLLSLTAQVVLPEGWTLKGITNESLGTINYNSENGMMLWYGEIDEQKTTRLLAQFTVTVPADAKGVFEVGLKDVELANFSVSGSNWTTTEKYIESITTTITIKDHAFNSKASSELASAADCTNAATYYVQCDNCDAVSDTKTVAVGTANGHAFNSKASGEQASAATCVAPATYKVQCDNCDAISADKTVAVGDPNEAHAYPTTPSGYTDLGDGTHIAYYVCGNDVTHVDTDAPVEHTYNQEGGTKCVCGAEKPAPVGLKGDVNLDGSVTLTDAVLAAQYFMDWDTNPITDAQIFYNADFNSDGVLSLTDAVEIAKYFMNN